MLVHVYNTLTRRVEPIEKPEDRELTIYSCGPTVYNYVHLGNLRAYVFLDFFKKYLTYRGYKINHVMNITDVDDKTIKGSIQKGESLQTYTDTYTKFFLEDLDALGIERPTVMPRASKHVQTMVQLIKTLLDNGHAYRSGDSIYFDISKSKNYGDLALLDRVQLKQNADQRLISKDEYEKTEVNDFVLWKGWKEEDGDVYWDTEIGKGRPGWHIECSAMSMEYLGHTIDIHMGGVDLIFPHHTNEIAQSEAVTGEPFVKIWLHNEHLLVGGKKMSKSLNNFYTLREVTAKGYHPLALRLALLKTHYQHVLDFEFTRLDEASTIINKMVWFMLDLSLAQGTKIVPNISDIISESKESMTKAMDNNLNVSGLFESLSDFTMRIQKEIKNITAEQAKEILGHILEVDSFIGVFQKAFKLHERKATEVLAQPDTSALIEDRQRARMEEDYGRSDQLRDALAQKGLMIKDMSDMTYMVYYLNFMKD